MAQSKPRNNSGQGSPGFRKLKPERKEIGNMKKLGKTYSLLLIGLAVVGLIAMNPANAGSEEFRVGVIGTFSGSSAARQRLGDRSE